MPTIGGSKAHSPLIVLQAFPIEAHTEQVEPILGFLTPKLAPSTLLPMAQLAGPQHS
jgi:hypothetical protein